MSDVFDRRLHGFFIRSKVYHSMCSTTSNLKCINTVICGKRNLYDGFSNIWSIESVYEPLCSEFFAVLLLTGVINGQDTHSHSLCILDGEGAESSSSPGDYHNLPSFDI